MNRPDKPGEPSMEEILASIRRTSMGSEPPAAREPAGPQHGRLSQALKMAGTATHASSSQSKVPASFDDDLADLLDGPAETAPKPPVATSFAKAFPTPPPPAPPEPQAAKPAATAPNTSGPTAPPTADAVVPPLFGPLPTPPVVKAPAPAAIAEPTPTMPPLRTTGFFPPMGMEAAPKRVEPPPAPEAPSLAMPAPAKSTSGLDSIEEALNRLRGLGAAPPPQPTVMPTLPPLTLSPREEAPATPVPTTEQRAEYRPQPFPGARIEPELPLPKAVAEPAARAPASIPTIDSIALKVAALEEQAESLGSASEPQVTAETSPAAEPIAEVAAAPAAVETPIAVPPSPEPKSQDAAPIIAAAAEVLEAAEPIAAEPKVTAPPPIEAAIEPVAAPAEADRSPFDVSPLDKLALGLASTAAAAALGQPSLVQASQGDAPRVQQPIEGGPLSADRAPALRFDDAPEQRLAREPEPAPAAATSAASGRALEDVVADMLRPMLEKWIADNMPRIVEKALRVEASANAQPKKPNS